MPERLECLAHPMPPVLFFAPAGSRLPYGPQARYPGERWLRGRIGNPLDPLRPALPDDTPPEVRVFLGQCWAHKPSARPDASECERRMGEMMCELRLRTLGAAVKAVEAAREEAERILDALASCRGPRDLAGEADTLAAEDQAEALLAAPEAAAAVEAACRRLAAALAADAAHEEPCTDPDVLESAADTAVSAASLARMLAHSLSPEQGAAAAAAAAANAMAAAQQAKVTTKP